MPCDPIAQLIAQALPNLTWPGDDKHGPTPLILPTFRNQAIPPEMAEQFAHDAGLPHVDLAKLTAEAIVATIEGSGYTVINNAELADMRRATAEREPQRHTQQQFHCTCGQPLFKAAIIDFDTDKPKISPSILRALQNVSAECATGHR